VLEPRGPGESGSGVRGDPGVAERGAALSAGTSFRWIRRVPPSQPPPASGGRGRPSDGGVAALYSRFRIPLPPAPGSAPPAPGPAPTAARHGSLPRVRGRVAVGAAGAPLHPGGDPHPPPPTHRA